MTVVLAVKAADGVVMTADGATTIFSPFGEAYALQTTEKVHSCADRFVWGASGDEGVIQRIKHRLDAVHLSDFRPKDPETFRAKIVPIVLDVLRGCRKDHIGPVMGGVRDIVPCAEVLFAAHLPTGPCVVMIDPTGKNAVLAGPHIAIGSGARAAMAIMHKHRGETRDSRLTQVVSYRAVMDAIEVTPEYLAPPISMGVVEDAGGQEARARILSSTELNGIRDSVEVWIGYEREALQKTLGSLSAADTGTAPGEEPPAVR